MAAILLRCLAVVSALVTRTQSAATDVITGTAKDDRPDHHRRFFLVRAACAIGGSALFAAKPTLTARRLAR